MCEQKSWVMGMEQGHLEPGCPVLLGADASRPRALPPACKERRRVTLDSASWFVHVHVCLCVSACQLSGPWTVETVELSASSGTECRVCQVSAQCHTQSPESRQSAHPSSSPRLEARVH